VHYAVKGLQMIFKQGYHYKKAGVIVMNITPENSCQTNLFQQAHPKHQQLMDVIDKINHINGSQKIKLACQDLGRTWKMRQEKLSKRYTTRLDEIITIHL
jgi:DNA polymerase V